LFKNKKCQNQDWRFSFKKNEELHNTGGNTPLKQNYLFIYLFILNPLSLPPKGKRWTLLGA
jgi:hypothetical protein